MIVGLDATLCDNSCALNCFKFEWCNNMLYVEINNTYELENTFYIEISSFYPNQHVVIVTFAYFYILEAGAKHD